MTEYCDRYYQGCTNAACNLITYYFCIWTTIYVLVIKIFYYLCRHSILYQICSVLNLSRISNDNFIKTQQDRPEIKNMFWNTLTENKVVLVHLIVRWVIESGKTNYQFSAFPPLMIIQHASCVFFLQNNWSFKNI